MLNSFAKGIKYLFLAFVLIGVAFLVTPTKGYAFDAYGVTKTIPNGVTLPYTYYTFLPNTLNDQNPTFGSVVGYDLPFDNLPTVCQSSGEYSFSYNFSMFFGNTFRNVKCTGVLKFTFTLYYTDSNGNQQHFLLGNSFVDLTLDESTYGQVINFSLPVHVQGRPDKVHLVISNQDNYDYRPFVFYPGDSLTVDLNSSGSSSSSSTIYLSGSTEAVQGSYSGENGMQNGQWWESYGQSAYGTFSTQAGNANGDLNIPSTRFQASFSLPSSSSSDYSGTIDYETVNPSGSRFIFGISTYITDFVGFNSPYDLDSKLSNLGFSPLNFALNGDFLYSLNHIHSNFLDPLAFNSEINYSFYSQLCILDGEDKYPISIIGDSRKGDYCLYLGFKLTQPLSSSDLSTIFSTSWGFEFNKGQSTSFGLPSNTQMTYVYFPNDDDFYYLNLYFFFTTPDYFDSFLLRSGPTIPNVKNSSFAFCKYVGTVSDQINADQLHWDAQLPSHSSSSSVISSATSTISTFQTLEDNSFNSLNNQLSVVDQFSLTGMYTPIYTVSFMLNEMYTAFPSEVKWIIISALIIGIFAVIISANFYVNKD